jgi:hypothetical protein
VHEPLVPPCAEVAAVLEQRGVHHAYASYNTAWCLTYRSGERIVASQPWNERFYGYPLPLLDEVRFASDAAWVLVPGADFDLMAPRHLEAKLDAGHYRRTEVGGATIFDAWVPPLGPAVRAVAVGRTTTAPVEVAVASGAEIAGLTLLAGIEAPLPAGLVVEVSSGDGAWERLERRRDGRERIDPAWVNGHPQMAWDRDVATLSFTPRRVAVVRVSSLPAGPTWSLDRILLHGPATGRPWPDPVPPGLGWEERILWLRAHPRPTDADWHTRTLLATRHAR